MDRIQSGYFLVGGKENGQETIRVFNSGEEMKMDRITSGSLLEKRESKMDIIPTGHLIEGGKEGGQDTIRALNSGGKEDGQNTIRLFNSKEKRKMDMIPSEYLKVRRKGRWTRYYQSIY